MGFRPRDFKSLASSQFRHPGGAGAAPRAGNGTRTRDPNLGKVVLYQLSYSREANRRDCSHRPLAAQPLLLHVGRGFQNGRGPMESGGEGDRTPDLVNAIHALSQLSYAPVILSRPTASADGQGKLVPALRGVKTISRGAATSFG